MVMRQALAGMLWSKQYYYYDVERWLRRARRRPVRPERASQLGAQRRLVPHGQPATSSRCRTSGSTPGSRPGTSRSTARRCRSSISTSPSSSSSCCCATRTCTPTASSPPTSGTSATSTRRCTPGPRCSSTSARPRSAAQGDRDFLSASFHKLLLNFTWWVNRKDPDGQNVFEGGFLGLDNIGVFDRCAAARRRQARAGRRHGVDGALLPDDARRSRSSWPRGPGLRGHGAQVLRALPVDRRRDEPTRRRQAAVGRGGRLLLRRAAPARRQPHAAQGAFDGRPAAAVRRDGVRAGDARQHARFAAMSS